MSKSISLHPGIHPILGNDLLWGAARNLQLPPLWSGCAGCCPTPPGNIPPPWMGTVRSIWSLSVSKGSLSSSLRSMSSMSFAFFSSPLPAWLSPWAGDGRIHLRLNQSSAVRFLTWAALLFRSPATFLLSSRALPGRRSPSDPSSQAFLHTPPRSFKPFLPKLQLVLPLPSFSFPTSFLFFCFYVARIAPCRRCVIWKIFSPHHAFRQRLHAKGRPRSRLPEGRVCQKISLTLFRDLRQGG